MRYEDLAADPLGAMRGLYDALGLGGFAAVETGIRRYLDEACDFRPARYKVSAEERSRIEERCGAMMRRFGYAAAEPSPAASARPARAAS